MRYCFAVAALVCGASLASADELKVASLDKVDALPCAIFLSGPPFGSLRDGVSLEIPISSANNTELFKRLADRMNRCKDAAVIHQTAN
jgi:hypothetical protein